DKAPSIGSAFRKLQRNGNLINLGDEESPISDGEVISVLWNHERQNYYVR
ncbi:hypothetical protein IAE51_11755, partial [Lactococcus sp. S64]|nr:hypothetical protein [Lactococcus sp. S64]